METETEQLFEHVENGDAGAVMSHLDRRPDDVNARSNDDDCETPLHCAAMQGSKSVMVVLIAKGADVNATAAMGRTPLHWAAWNGNFDAARLLLVHGADPNARITARSDYQVSGFTQTTIEEGFSPLHYAAYEGHAEIVKLLIEHGADVNAVSAQGWTPLHRARFKNNEKVIGLLEAHGGHE